MTSNIFGTSGIRKVFVSYSESDLMFTPHMALDVGLALGTYLQKKNLNKNLDESTVVIGRDIRTSALPIEYALISGLICAGCAVKTLGIVTTPTLAMSLNILKANAGCMITASHNTPEYIGLKVWNPSGMGFTTKQEEIISEIYDKKDFIKTKWDQIGKVTEINDFNDTHIQDITERIKFNGENLNVIADPGNGSSCEIVPKLLSKYNINITTLNSNMDGKFPGRLSEPSKENLKKLSNFIKASDNTDIGIALDGDADRVIFLDGNGERVDPIRLLALMGKYYLERQGSDIIDIKNKIIVTPINSSSLLEDVLSPLGCKINRCEVGDIKVAIALKENNGFLGGENSGTYIWPDIHYGPDSIATIARILKMIVESKKNLQELLKDIPKYPFYRKNISLKDDIPFTNKINEDIINIMKETFEDLGRKILNINKMDGVRFDYDEGWILIRRSGTSPYLRISGESNINIEKSKEINEITQEKMKILNLI
ncbi:MAG: phosphoglucosamine mutase [Candidatus Lokiarchaeota archaeon]|nr:phosphoglucosamine mutase [Candidatus Lokiarchaeota archaeon]